MTQLAEATSASRSRRHTRWPGWRSVAGSAAGTAPPTGAVSSRTHRRGLRRRRRGLPPVTSSRSAGPCSTRSPPSRSGRCGRSATRSRPPSAAHRPAMRPSCPDTPSPALTSPASPVTRRTTQPSLGSSVMEQRILGRTGRAVSVIGLGTWQLGSDWGEVDEGEAFAILDAAVESGVTFLDTATSTATAAASSSSGGSAGGRAPAVMVATKMGQRVALDPALYTLENFRAWTDGSGPTSAWTCSTWSSCIARRPPYSPRTRCTTRWTPWLTRGGSPPTGSAWRPATRR